MNVFAFADRVPPAATLGLPVVLWNHPAKFWLTWAMLSTTGVAGGESAGSRASGSVCQSLPPVLVQRRAVMTKQTAGNATASLLASTGMANGTTAVRHAQLLQQRLEEHFFEAARWTADLAKRSRSFAMALLAKASLLNSSFVDEVQALDSTAASLSSPAIFLLSLVVVGMVLSVCMALYCRSQPRFGPRQETSTALPPEVLRRARSSRSGFSGPPPSLLTSPVGSPSYRKASSSDKTLPRTRWLCPSLVVPSGMELVFAVSEVVSADKQQIAFHIVDLQGQPLSRVVIDEFGSRCGIFLHSLDDRPLAWVRTAHLYEKGGGLPEICWPSGEVYGTIAKEDPVPHKRYMLRDTSGQRLLTFNGNFQEKAINVVNASGRLVCDTERCAAPRGDAPYYQVRVAPSVDAGLILCGLLAIDKLRRT